MRQNARLVFLAVVMTAACATPQKTAQVTPNAAERSGASGAPNGPAAPPTEVTEASLRINGAGAFEMRDDIRTVNFDFDSARLSEGSLAILKANAEAIRASAGSQFL